MTGEATILHGTAVAAEGHAVLLIGAPDTGKSTVALEMIALGAELVADDQVHVADSPEGLQVSAPDAIAGLIEARGVGLLRMEHLKQAPLFLICNLDRPETRRLPQFMHHRLLDRPVPVIFGKGRVGLAAILMVLLGGAELLDPDAT